LKGKNERKKEKRKNDPERVKRRKRAKKE